MLEASPSSYIVKSPAILGHLRMRQKDGLGIFLWGGVNWTLADSAPSFQAAD
jgi:hypothetical protein